MFFHDYHLYVAPALVREQRPEATLAHFTHIPWVDAEAWSVLPASIVTAIHAGLLANDVVGFHTERWRSAFLSACSSLGLDTGDALVTAHPISIDPDEFASLAESEEVLARERELVASRPEAMILRVDRTDPSKNVVRGLEAFGLLLERRPDLRGRVGMVALLDPSRQEIPEYVEELHRIEAAAAALEERFPGALQLRVGDDFPQSVAAYKQFDVLLVNAIMDGLNLVAKEAPLVNTRDGVVVLSVNAGAYEELGEWTVPVDPLDVEGQASGARGRSRAAGRRAPGAAGGDPRARAHPRPGGVDRRPAGRPRPRQYDAAVDERPLARRRVRLGAHGRRRRQADVAAPGGRARLRADGRRDGAATRLPAEGRRARDRAARRDHGREADERPDPALPPAAAVGRRGLARGGRGGVEITAAAETTAQTGVEMEALVAASVAALTVYDMAKAIDKEMVIAEVTLVEKTKADV